MFTQKCSKVCCIKRIFTATGGLSQGGFLELGLQGGPVLYLQNLGGGQSQPVPPHEHTGSNLETDSDSSQDGPRTQGRDPRFRRPEMSHIYHTTTTRQTAENLKHGGSPQALQDRKLASIRPCWALEPKIRMGSQGLSLHSVGPSLSEPWWGLLGSIRRQQGGPSLHHPSQRSRIAWRLPTLPQPGDRAPCPSFLEHCF